MLISHKHRFIFIHIYKNAGTSITQALLPFALDSLPGMLRHFQKKPSTSDVTLRPYPPHITAKSIAEKIGRDHFRSYFSFAIVRNPWDWQVSLYTYMLQSPQHYQHKLVKSFRSFDEYIIWRCDKDIRLQKDFIYSEDGEKLVDFIGRYENLNEDFKTICSRINIPANLRHLNKSRTKPYQDYYSQDIKERVAQAFKPDINLFQYDFE